MGDRPKKGEKLEDLLEQEKELLSRKDFKPAAAVTSVTKRKSEERASAGNADCISRSTSKFAASRESKKKREGIVDNTILREAASQERQKAVVLGKVIERNVPPVASFLQHWEPVASPHGNPQVYKLSSHNEEISTKSGITGRRKSLYMADLEKRGIIKPDQELAVSLSSFQGTQSADFHMKASKGEEDEKLVALGSHSYVLSQKSELVCGDEAKTIHQESISKMALMSHEECIKERNELLTQMPPDKIQFLLSLRQKRKTECAINSENKMDICETEVGGELSTGSSVGDESERHIHKNMEVESSLETNSYMQGAAEIMAETPAMNTRVTQETFGLTEAKDPGTWKDAVSKHSPRKVRFTESEGNKAGHGEELPDELPIPPEEAKKWIHMDKVEIEKLKWMSNAPPPHPLKHTEGFVARFNFEGDLLPYDADISWREGLHHHGQEPGRAGYTIDELFILVRSNVLQQRHLGLRTLGNILRNVKEGLYDECLDTPVLQLMVEAGLVLLIRFALDESSPLAYQEAVRALYYLICSEPDELCLDMVQTWIPLGIQPGISSRVYAATKTRQELDSEERELKDIEIIQLDIIRALFRMDTHVRLNYLLKVVKPAPPYIINILGIFTRIARHSLGAAWKIAETPGLLKTVIENFLPHDLSPLLTGQNVSQMKSVYGVPVRHCLKLLRVLALRGRQLAALLVNTHDIMSHILAYVSFEPSEIELPLGEALLLLQDAYCLWQILLDYGLSKPQEAVISFYPFIIRQLIFYRDKVAVNIETESNIFNYDVGAHIMVMLCGVLNVAATHTLLTNLMKMSEPSLQGVDGKGTVLPPPELCWSSISNVPELVKTCLSKWLTQLARDGEMRYSVLRLSGSCCQFLGIYFRKWKDQICFSGSVYRTDVENLYNSVLIPFIGSDTFRKMLQSLKSFSALGSGLCSGTARDPRNLSSLGCVTLGGKMIPLLQRGTPFPLLLPLTSLLVDLQDAHPLLDKSPLVRLLNDDSLISYLESICVSQQTLASQFMSRTEMYFIMNLLQLSYISGCNNMPLFHITSLKLIPYVHRGDEHIIQKLVVEVVCNPDFTADISEIATQMDCLDISEYEPLHSPAVAQPSLSYSQLTSKLCKSFKSIGSDLCHSLISQRMSNHSSILKNKIPFLINTMTVDATESVFVVNDYWPLLPIRTLYSSESIGSSSSDQSKPETVLLASKCLQVAYMLLKYRKKSLTHTTVTGWVINLSLIFLACSDLFLDVTVSSYLQGCLYELLKMDSYMNFDENLDLTGIPSNYDWYKQMIEQYMSVSYGDSTFALFLLLPLQQRCAAKYRFLLWGENPEALSNIHVSCKQVKTFIPLEKYLEPPEESEELIKHYMSTLNMGLISPAKTPFLYKVASHHVKVYVERLKK